MVDLGMLSVGLSVATSPLDVLDARLRAMEAMPHNIMVNIDTSNIKAGFGGAFQQEMAANAAATGQAEQAVASFSRTTAASAASIDTASVALKGMEGNTKGVITGLLGISGTAVGILAVGAALGVAVKSATEFQQALANLNAVGHFSPTDFSTLGAGIQESSRTSVFSITQIAEADTILAKSGADANAIIREQSDVLNLAAASNTSAANAAAGLVAAQKSFGLTAKDSTMIADDLSKAVDSSVGTFQDMTDALKQVGPVAQQAGLSLNDTTTAIAALENAGLSGDTGSGLKIFLQRLEAPSAQAKTAIHDLGLEVYDANGKMKSLADIADQLRLKTIGLSDEAKNTDLTQIFGARGVRVADIFSEQGSDGLQAVAQHEAELGSAADIAQTKLATLSGQMKELKSSGDTVAANVGGVLVPALSAAGSEFTDLLNSITKITSGLADMGAAGKYGQQISDAVRSATNAPIGDQPYSRDEQRSNLLAERQALQDQIAQLQPGVDASKGDILGHLLGDDGGKAKLDVAKEGLTQVNAEIAKLDPAALASQGLQQLSQREADLAAQFSRGQITMDQAVASGRTWSQTALAMGADTATVTNSLIDYNTALKNIADAQYEARYIALQTQQTERDRAKQLLDEGAPSNLVETAVFGKGLGVDPGILLEQQAELASWEKTYAAEQASAKQNDAAQLASAKQRITDEATADKAALTERTATQTAAQAVEQAWSQAASAIDGIDKHLDGSAAIASLSGVDDQLHKVQDSLTRVGQDSPHLDALVRLTDVFKGITDQEDKANAALNGYNLTLTETNKSIQAIGSLKSEYLAALDAAEKRVSNGTADQSDRDIIAARSSALSTLDQSTSRLQQNANKDILGKLTNLPDYEKLDTLTRDIVARNGGGQGLLLNVTTTADAAQKEIQDKLLQAKQTQIDIKTNAAEVQRQIDTIAKARTADLTIVTHFVDAQGRPTVDPTLDPARGYGEPQGGTGYVPPAGGGSTMTPRGDAANLQPLSGDIQAAAQKYGLPPWLIGSIIMHESGGTVGDVQQGGLGRGLMQVDGGYHPEANDPRMTGTSPTDAAYQIDIGSRILKEMIDAHGMNEGTQDYAGPGYQSVKNGPVPAGMRLPDEISQYYEAPVAAAIGPYSTDARGGVGAGGNPGYGAADAALTIGNQFANLTPTAANSSTPAILAQAQRAIGEKLDRFGRDVYGRCEEIVDDIVQDATGKDTRFPTADAHVRAAMAGQAGAGQVIDRSQARPGDLVGWTGDSKYAGDPAGHIGVYSGGNNYIGTTTNGVEQRPLGPDAVFIRPDGVVAGGPVPGAVLYTGRGSVAPGSPAATQAAASTSPGSVPPNINATTGGVQQLSVSADQLNKALETVNANLAKLDAPSIKAAQADFQSILPTLTTMQEKAAQIGDTPLTSTEKKQADAVAWEQSLRYEAAYIQLLSDMENHTGDLAADTQKVADVVGGPMADAYAKAALASAQLAASQSEAVRLQTQQKAADDAQQDVVKQRQIDDQATSRFQTVRGWGQQYLQNQLADKQTAENTSYTQTQRDEQDRQRALQFAQQVGATDLQNKLTDLQKSQQNTVYNRTSQEQLAAANVKGASTNQGAASAAASLAAMHDQDLAQKDLNTKAIDSIQLQIREQAKQSNLESYNLQTETIAAQRKHENIMQGYTVEGTALSRQAEAQSRADTIAQWRLQDTRTAEDLKYTTEKDANALAITAQQRIQTSAQASLDAANQSLTAWQQTGVVVASAAGLAAQAASQNNYAANPAYTRRLGTYATGGTITEPYALVGEHGPEIIQAPGYRVTPAPQTAAILNGGGNGGGGTTVNNLNLGDLALTISDEDRAELTALMQRIVDKSKKAGVAKSRALGIN